MSVEAATIHLVAAWRLSVEAASEYRELLSDNDCRHSQGLERQGKCEKCDERRRRWARKTQARLDFRNRLRTLYDNVRRERPVQLETATAYERARMLEV